MGPSGESCLILKNSERRFALTAGQSWAIGRGSGCDVTLDSRSVSRLHALIQRRDEGDYSLVDLGSRNGSFVNGRRVSVPVPLRDGDQLVFGDQEARFSSPSGLLLSQAQRGDTTRDAPTTSLLTNSLITVVVVDIRDFTRLARSVPEAVLSQTIGTWFLRSGQVAQSRGSWAQKYIGDAVMAVWLHERRARIAPDLQAALRAVSEIENATAEISRALPLPEPLRIGAGVNTGPAIVGGPDYTALGDTVNAAFRLEAATKQIGLGVALGQRTSEEMALDSAGPFARREVHLKGYDLPSTAWAISFEGLREYVGQEQSGDTG